ncbi:catalase/peroxidase HPI [Thiotrichales bacterium 19S3-7]|nr:catalase/peroxidase HPI [Thiotrichales bacterium 19S3-7]MCF6801629.1 catalase/peroxidase HPI [Thiotrichales bacterium 19S3-11]
MLKQITSILLLALAVTSTTAIAENQPKTNDYWWPKKLDLSPLRNLNELDSPMNRHYHYKQAFQKLDVKALRADMIKLLTTSQDWWPADFGNYGPFFIRLSWHSAGTYRVFDGRGGADGGQIRFAPLNSWPDNVNLDKARRLLWPIKQKYGDAVSWSDLIVYAGTVAMESMGVKTIGFAFGREDDWQSDQINWGEGDQWLSSNLNKKADLKKPFAATQMGLIYVNPEGPGGNPDPLLAAKQIRDTFARMGMNDQETVALIAGGHSFGKAHGAASPKYLGPAPEAAPIQEQGLGWKNSFKKGDGPDTITSGLEGSWTITPAKWNDSNYFENLYTFKWVKTKSPAGATQWRPKNKSADNLVPDAFDPNKRHAPMMFTTDLSMKADPDYNKISEYFKRHPKAFEAAFAEAWFKLTHRDMGPTSRYLGPWVPKEVMIWQDPIPKANYKLVNAKDVASLKVEILNSGLTMPELIKTAWASASSYRKTDMRGGANGARVALLPQKDWPANEPKALANVLSKLQAIQTKFNQSQTDGRKISLADLIILAGNTAVEEGVKKAGYKLTIPFIPGRTDASQKETDIQSFGYLEPTADGFINYFDATKTKLSPPQALVNKASMLDLNIPQMTVLVGGLRVLNANYDNSQDGVFTNNPGALSNDYFVNLLDMSIVWKKSKTNEGEYEGYDRKTGKLVWKATSVDLIFGSNSELRAVAEVYGSSDAKKKFIKDFVRAWVKVMNLGRFDLAPNPKKGKHPLKR